MKYYILGTHFRGRPYWQIFKIDYDGKVKVKSGYSNIFMPSTNFKTEEELIKAGAKEIENYLPASEASPV